MKGIELLLATLPLLGVMAIEQAQAQVVAPSVDNVNSTGTTVEVDRFQTNIDIKGGQTSSDGANLFHSFEQFGLNQGQIANFVQPNDNIQNILARVSGGNVSLINGNLQVTGGNSNLFLINPSGIIFGPSASLNLNGAFTATTANGIGFGSSWFSATGTNNYADLVGTPSAFAFTMEQPGAIVNAGNLSVLGEGKNLTLIAGTVANTGQLNASAGAITVAAVPGKSVVRLSQAGNVLSLDVQPLTTTSTQPNNWTIPILSLPDLLTGGGGGNATGLEVNSNGQVELTGSGLQVENGDVVAKEVIAERALLSADQNLTLVKSGLFTAEDLQLTANNNLTVVESTLIGSGNLNMLAGNTIEISDTEETPSIFRTEGNLSIQGNRAINIEALSRPESIFYSNGSLSLISDGLITGNGRFYSNGNFSILNSLGGLGNLRYNSVTSNGIISSAGDVSFGTYEGASLKVEAGGNITANGNITITEPNTALRTITEPNTALRGTDPDIAILVSRPALILRAGLTQRQNVPNVVPGSTQLRNEANVPFGLVGGATFTSTEARSGPGNITVKGTISAQPRSFPFQDSSPIPGGVIMSAAGNITVEGDIASPSIELSSAGNIQTGLLSSGLSNNNTDIVKLTSTTGDIKVKGISTGNQNGGGIIDIKAGGIFQSTDIAGIDDTTKQFFSLREKDPNFNPILLNFLQNKLNRNFSQSELENSGEIAVIISPQEAPLAPPLPTSILTKKSDSGSSGDRIGSYFVPNNGYIRILYKGASASQPPKTGDIIITGSNDNIFITGPQVIKARVGEEFLPANEDDKFADFQLDAPFNLINNDEYKNQILTEGVSGTVGAIVINRGGNATFTNGVVGQTFGSRSTGGGNTGGGNTGGDSTNDTSDATNDNQRLNQETQIVSSSRLGTQTFGILVLDKSLVASLESTGHATRLSVDSDGTSELTGSDLEAEEEKISLTQRLSTYPGIYLTDNSYENVYK